ncbi:tetratricopeptide repeat protein [Thiomicrorhabdus heinhorstiae]|uniref:Tetratricopeptide repeat protein n=1 Tax=Thiomicrorhabdus heinhorstiae TaxID=2748010 RepID=A0ABS0BTJ4_9GAMM|nr:tetratricopeptide repeat protein [Thiomicrorhabdus heinhorstiae]MBF6057124.1 tetratricopeptide repeat protein [Thiomicrorhabdus heinhorstiae]
MQQAMIADIDNSNFQELVLAASSRFPVFLHFWSPHNPASLEANRILEELAQRYAGKWILAKLNTAAQSELSQRFGTLQTPQIRIIEDATAVQQIDGLQSKVEYQTLIEEYINPDPSEVLRKQAAQAYAQGNAELTENKLKQAIQANPDNDKSHLDLTQLYFRLGRIEEARQLFEALPESSRQTPQGKFISGLIHFQEVAGTLPDTSEIQQRIQISQDDGDALFALSGYLLINNHAEKALQTLLKLYELEKDGDNNRAQQSLLKAFEMLDASAPQLVANYRRKYQNLLY